MKLSLTPAILAVSLFALPAHAQTVDLSWNTCSPIVTSKIAPEGALVSFYASITGQSEGHKGYELWWLVGNASQALPDAWRFDGAGCTASAFAYNSRAPHDMASFTRGPSDRCSACCLWRTCRCRPRR